MKAARELKRELEKIFPDSRVEILPPVADADRLLVVAKERSFSLKEREKIVEAQVEVQEKYKVTFAVIPMPEEQMPSVEREGL
jgi:hypothetical protein